MGLNRQGIEQIADDFVIFPNRRGIVHVSSKRLSGQLKIWKRVCRRTHRFSSGTAFGLDLVSAFGEILSRLARLRELRRRRF